MKKEQIKQLYKKIDELIVYRKPTSFFDLWENHNKIVEQIRDMSFGVPFRWVQASFKQRKTIIHKHKLLKGKLETLRENSFEEYKSRFRIKQDLSYDELEELLNGKRKT